MKPWTDSTLGEVLNVVRGVSYKKEQASNRPADGYLPILRATNIQNGLTFDELVYVPRSNISSEQLLRKNDIVIAASSGSRAVVGKAAQLNEDWKGSFGAFCFGLRPKEGVNPRFVGWFLQTREYRNRVSELAAGVNINNLRAKHIEETPIRVPSLDEQKRIVAEIEKQFTRLDAGVASLKRAQNGLKRYRASVLKAACEGRLVATETELARKENRTYQTGEQLLQRILEERREKWNGKGKYKEPLLAMIPQFAQLPEGWTWASADQISFQITDGEHIQPRYSDDGYPILSAKHVRKGFVVFTDAPLITKNDFDLCLKRCAPTYGDILVVCVGATTGRAAIVGNTKPFALVRSILLIRTLISPRFLLAWLQSPSCQSWIQRASGSSAQAHFYIKDARKMPVPLPPFPEQERIVADLERRLSVIEELETAAGTDVRRANNLRKSILHRMFSAPNLGSSIFIDESTK